MEERGHRLSLPSHLNLLSPSSIFANTNRPLFIGPFDRFTSSCLPPFVRQVSATSLSPRVAALVKIPLSQLTSYPSTRPPLRNRSTHTYRSSFDPFNQSFLPPRGVINYSRSSCAQTKGGCSVIQANLATHNIVYYLLYLLNLN